MPYYLHSFYQLDGQVYFLNEIEYRNKPYLSILECRTNNFRLDPWCDNQYIILDKSKLVSLEANLSWQNSECESCVYFSNTKVNIYRDAVGLPQLPLIDYASQLFYSRCELRNDAFKEGCQYLFVNCPYKTVKYQFEGIYLNKDDSLYGILTRNMSSFFQADGYNRVIPKKFFLEGGGNNYSFTPKEFEIYIQNCKPNEYIIGSSFEGFSAVTSNEITEDPIWAIKAKDFTLSQYFSLFMKGYCDIILNESATLAIAWMESPRYFVTGSRANILNYIQSTAQLNQEYARLAGRSDFTSGNK